MAHLNVTMSKYDCHVTLYGHVGVFSTKNVKLIETKGPRARQRKLRVCYMPTYSKSSIYHRNKC